MVIVLEKKCGGCGICVVSCPEDAVRLWGYPEIDREQCTDCLICAENCPVDAITVES